MAALAAQEHQKKKKEEKKKRAAQNQGTILSNMNWGSLFHYTAYSLLCFMLFKNVAVFDLHYRSKVWILRFFNVLMYFMLTKDVKKFSNIMKYYYNLK